MKYWQEHCLVKHIEEQFSEINIDDLHKYAREMAGWS